jgi:hypothetical protein
MPQLSGKEEQRRAAATRVTNARTTSLPFPVNVRSVDQYVRLELVVCGSAGAGIQVRTVVFLRLGTTSSGTIRESDRLSIWTGLAIRASGLPRSLVLGQQIGHCFSQLFGGQSFFAGRIQSDHIVEGPH